MYSLSSGSESASEPGLDSESEKVRREVDVEVVSDVDAALEGWKEELVLVSEGGETWEGSREGGNDLRDAGGGSVLLGIVGAGDVKLRNAPALGGS